MYNPSYVETMSNEARIYKTMSNEAHIHNPSGALIDIYNHCIEEIQIQYSNNSEPPEITL